MKVKSIILNAYALSKPRVSASVAVSAAIGAALAPSPDLRSFISTVVGTFFLSAAGSAWNQIQERPYDALMKRTRMRPLPSGKLTTRAAWALVLVYALYGFAALLSAGIMPAAMGAAALVFYNLMYTPLKRRTACAFVPGAIVGALPPAIGWSASGGSIGSPALWAIALFFFIWQLPHFWFIALLREEEYRAAGFPSPAERLDARARQAVGYYLVFMLAAACLLVPLGSDGRIWAQLAACFAAATVLIFKCRMLMRRELLETDIKKIFKLVNAFALSVALFVSLEKLISK